MPSDTPQACCASTRGKIGKIRRRIGNTIALAMLGATVACLLKETCPEAPVAVVGHGISLTLIACAVLIFIKKNPGILLTCPYAPRCCPGCPRSPKGTT